MPLKFILQRPASLANKPVSFKLRPASECSLDFRSTSTTDCVQSILVDKSVTASPPSKHHQSHQINWSLKVDKSTFYESSLKLDDPTELENPCLVDFLSRATPLLQQVLTLNHLTAPPPPSLFSPLQTELAQILEQDPRSALSDVQTYTDLTYSFQKLISCISVQSDLALVSYTPKHSLESYITSRSKGELFYSLLWTLNNSMAPLAILPSSSLIVSCAISPFNSCSCALLSASGTLSLFHYDESGPSSLLAPFATSSPHQSHSNRGVSVVWKSESCLISVGSEGVLKYWEIRGDELVLGKSLALSCFNTSLQNDFDLFPVRQVAFLDDNFESLAVGTENGTIAIILTSSDYVDSNPQNPDELKLMEESASLAAEFLYFPSFCLSSCPFLPSLLASAEGSVLSLYHNSFLLARIPCPNQSIRRVSVSFSPSRPGLLAVGRSDGVVELWDLTEKIHGPVVSNSVSSGSIVSLRFNGVDLNLGDSLGCLFVKTVSPCYHRSSESHDLEVLNRMIDSLRRIESFHKAISRSINADDVSVFARFEEGGYGPKIEKEEEKRIDLDDLYGELVGDYQELCLI
ncbi:hypothetical protein P9112_011240 [Eukaryota sp. TZLM1-RC]